VELAVRARDRNDDFVNALPSAGRAPLRPVVYHPAISGVLLRALDRARTAGLMSAGQVGDVAVREWRHMDRDLPAVFQHGDNAFWGLFLSDYLSLALRSLVAPEQVRPELSEAELTHILDSVDRFARLLTDAGHDAYVSLSRRLGRPAASPETTPLREPDSFDRFPCGSLIEQAEIERWLAVGRRAPRTDDGRVMPEYRTARPRYRRPRTTDPVELYDLSLRQVGVAQSDPDGWWAALDIALYRWELTDRYDAEAVTWVRQIAYDTFKVKENGTATGPLWAWAYLVDVFEYCRDRLIALLPTIDPNRPVELRDAQGHENWFATFLYRSLQASGDTRRLNAFEYDLYTTLHRSHRGNLTPDQIQQLRMLEHKYGPSRPT
jgi:hypothetical protein